MNKEQRTQNGFSLIELTIAIGVLVIGILTAAFCIYSLQGLGELAQEKEMAVADANRVLEAMRDSANDSIATLRNTNWTTWATNNVISTKGASELALDQENVSVSMDGGNPVPITLILSWRHKRQPYTYRIVTLMTDRG